MDEALRLHFKMAVRKVLASADGLGGSLHDKADRISNDVADEVERICAEVARRERERSAEPPLAERRGAAAGWRREALALLKRIAAELGTPPPGADFKPSPALGYVSRLQWLVGLSDAERAFVDAAATAALTLTPGAAYGDLMVFADWLEDNLTPKESSRLRSIAEREAVRAKGWVNLHSTTADAVATLLANMPEKDRKGDVFQRALWALDRLQREAKDLRAQARGEAAACREAAGEVESLRAENARLKAALGASIGAA